MVTNYLTLQADDAQIATLQAALLVTQNAANTAITSATTAEGAYITAGGSVNDTVYTTVTTVAATLTGDTTTAELTADTATLSTAISSLTAATTALNVGGCRPLASAKTAAHTALTDALGTYTSTKYTGWQLDDSHRLRDCR